MRRLILPYPEIQALTLEEVVEYGLNWLGERTDKNVMIEDSGLFIDALNGFPGVYSAYVFKQLGCTGVLKQMDGVKRRTAQFLSCAGLLVEGKKTILTGICKGTIARKAQGKGGFGYDPIFMPQGRRVTFGQMKLEEKNRLSHRARALDKVAKYLKRVGRV